MLELDVIVGGPTSPSRVCTLPHCFAVEYRLRFIHINLGYATTTSPAIKLCLLMVKIIVSKFD